MLKFAHTEYLYALLLLPVLFLWFLLVMRWKRKKTALFAEPGLVAILAPDIMRWRQYLKYMAMLLALGFIILAVANPQLGSKLEKGQRKGIDLFLCVDVSNSMLAEDIKPNRLERTKNALAKMIDELKNDRIGVIIFAGKAYVQLPITTDYSAAKLFISNISTEIIPTQGTAIGDAITMAVNSFDENEHSKAIIVITDGENHEDDAIQAARDAASKGIRIFTVGMGLPDGAPIPVFRNGISTGFRKDGQGNTIITKLNDPLLREIAAAGQGSYIRASNTQSSLDRIYKEINQMQKTEFETTTFSEYETRFQYMLLVALVLLCFEVLIFERRNKTLSKIRLFG
ncbi:MAG TPA: VWA domain-containing protein [Bacteroidales bacterium]|nr:VWA domain-containing protein [Bacteroidales bacterium]HSA43271.1 VWA domain-containing protein [Bacteroidales bacterium]